MFEIKKTINCRVADYVRYNDHRKDFADREPIVLHRWKRVMPSPKVIDRQIDYLIDPSRQSHIKFNRTLSGLVLDEILMSDLQGVEVIPLAGLMFR